MQMVKMVQTETWLELLSIGYLSKHDHDVFVENCGEVGAFVRKHDQPPLLLSVRTA